MGIGERIKQARSLHGFSLRDLAEKVGVSAQAISKYERGIDKPGSSILIKLADALKVKTEFFFRAVELKGLKPVYRKRLMLRKKEEGKILSRIHDWLERYLQIELIRGGGKEEDASAVEATETPSSLADIEKLADKFRECWELGTDPIENVIEVLERHNFKVGLVEGDDAFDACTFTFENDRPLPVFVIRKDLPGDRQRFSLAHELGHFLCKPSDALEPEKVANRFAAAFLVPMSAAYEELGRHRSALDLNELYWLKHKYGMSMMAWVYRAMDLSIISESRAQEYFRTFRAHGWHKKEPGRQVNPEEPTRFYRFVIQALTESVISESRASELLGKPIQEFRKEMSKKNEFRGNINF